MGIVKIYNVLGGFYKNYIITFHPKSVTKHFHNFSYFLLILHNS